MTQYLRKLLTPNIEADEKRAYNVAYLVYLDYTYYINILECVLELYILY